MKVVISVPDEVFEAGEHLARQLKLSRSQMYSEALALYLNARGAAAVTARLNSVYASNSASVDEAFVKSQEEILGHETR